MDGFNFFRSYYEASKHLSDIEQGMFYKLIMEYMFEDKEPEIDGALMGFWVLLKPTLDISKTRSKASQTKSKAKQTEIKQKSNDNQTNIKPISKAKQTEIKSETSPPRNRNRNRNREVDKGTEVDKKKIEKKEKSTFTYPKGYESIWQEWEDYREEIKKPLTDKARSIQVKMLFENKADLIEIIETSIQNSWTGLFQIKNKSSPSYRKPKPQEGSIGWMVQQQQEQNNAIDVEVE